MRKGEYLVAFLIFLAPTISLFGFVAYLVVRIYIERVKSWATKKPPPKKVQPPVQDMGPYRTPLVPIVQGRRSWKDMAPPSADVRVLTLCSRWDFEIALGRGVFEKRPGRDPYRVVHRCTPNCGGALHDVDGDLSIRCGCDGCNHEREKALDSLIQVLDDNTKSVSAVTESLNKMTGKLRQHTLSVSKK